MKRDMREAEALSLIESIKLLYENWQSEKMQKESKK